jgi:putative transposase
LVPQVIIQLVADLSNKYKIIEILQVLEVPKATYYRWKRKYSEEKISTLETYIIELCKESNFHNGHRKIKAMLKRKHGINVNRKTVQKVMQKFNLQCQIKVKRKKNINGESNITVENRLNRNFKATNPNENG